MKQLRVILPVLLILALATLACGLDLSKIRGGDEAPPAAVETTADEGQPPPDEEPGEEAQPPAQPAEGEAEPTEEAEAAEPPPEGAEGEVEEAKLDLDASLSDLETLNSYRASFRFDWEGTKNGEPVSGFMEMRSAFVREPPAQELYFEGEGFGEAEDQGLGKVAFIQVGDTAWFYESESDSWMQVPAGSLDFSEGLFFSPEDLLSDFDVSQGRRSLLPQEVNGVQAYKYTFNEKDFELTAGEEVEQAKGEVYVAVEGDYVVKLVIDADLRYSDPSELFEEGNVQMTFNISDVNQPITIEPPAEAEAQAGGREDIPMLPDAQVEFSGPELTSYTTASSAEEAARFYEEEMPKNEWVAEEGNMVLEDTALLSYTKGGETASIIIGTDEGGTNVLITVTNE